MGIITKPTTFVDGTVPTAAQFNGDFDTIYSEFNGNITNANVSASAAIALSKISGESSSASLTLVKYADKGKTLNTRAYSPSASGTATLDLSDSSRHVITMPAGNITIALSSPTITQPFVVEIVQDSGGSRTVTWFTTIKWIGGAAPTLSTGASKKDTFGFICTSSGNYDGYVLGQGIS